MEVPVEELSTSGCPTAPDTAATAWTPLGNGIEHAWFAFDPPPATGCPRLDVVRVDPSIATFQAYTEHLHGRGQKTAQEWCGIQGSTVVTNLGMYHPDGRHVGYQAVNQEIDQPVIAEDYRSVFLAAPGRATILDFEGSDLSEESKSWSIVSQNLRLIKAPGKNVWSNPNRKWSEAALGMDGQGRILLLHTRAALSMTELNERLLKLPLDLRHAMHLEGGPEASLSICAPGFSMHVAGGFESGFSGDDSRVQWPLPNVLTVTPG